MGAKRECKVKVTHKGQRASLFTWTGKMQAWSFSLPALDSCPFKYTESSDSICGSCYAAMNLYVKKNVLVSQHVRWNWTKYWIKHDPQYWIDFMTHYINQYADNGYFRLHDSGDFYSVDYAWAWREVCKNLPHIKFWAPTRNWRSDINKWIEVMKELGKLHNVALRPSALRFDYAPPKLKKYGYAAGTTAYNHSNPHKHTMLCPASKNSSSCEEEGCRKCWEKDVEIGYGVHGARGAKKQTLISPRILAARKDIKERHVS